MSEKLSSIKEVYMRSGGSMNRAARIVGHERLNVDPESLSEEEWDKLYSTYQQVHRAIGLESIEYEGFKKSVVRDLAIVTDRARSFDPPNNILREKGMID